MSEGFLSNAKAWFYKKLKSKPAQYFFSGISGIVTASTLFLICGTFLPLAAAVIIAGVTFLVVTVITQKKISSTLAAAEAIKPLESKVEKQAREIRYLKQTNQNLKQGLEQLSTQVVQLSKVTTTIVTHLSDKDVKDTCQNYLSPPSENTDELMGIPPSDIEIEMPPINNPSTGGARAPWGLFSTSINQFSDATDKPAAKSDEKTNLLSTQKSYGLTASDG